MRLVTITKAQRERLPEGIALYKTGDVHSIVMEGNAIVEEALPAKLIDSLALQAANNLCFEISETMFITEGRAPAVEKYYRAHGPSIAGLFADGIMDWNCDIYKSPVHIFVQSIGNAVIVPDSSKNLLRETVRKMSTDDKKPFSDYVFHKKFGLPLRMVPLKELYNKLIKEDISSKASHESKFFKTQEEQKLNIQECKELAAYRATGLSPEDIEVMKMKLSAIEKLVYQNEFVNEEQEEDAER